jgi:hypothetical protein
MAEAGFSKARVSARQSVDVVLEPAATPVGALGEPWPLT